jgi:putative transcription regulator
MRRGWNQAKLASRLGLTDRTVRAYETMGAPPNALSELADALGFPEGYFTLPSEPTVETESIRFRAGRATTRRQRDAAVAAGASGIEVDRWIAERFTLPKVDLPTLEGETPRLAATMLRSLWGLGSRPLPNLIQLAEFRGIRVNGLPEVAASVDAYSTWYEGFPHVFLARSKTPERARFDLAHEIGHLVLHRHRGPGSRAEEEREADAFASEFLMPAESVVEYLPPNPTIDEILRVKRAFAVSAMALTYTVHKLGRMTDWIYRTTCTALSQRGFRGGEPDGMVSYERSRVFPQILASSKLGVVTGKRIALELRIPVEDVRAAMLDAELHAVPDGPGQRLVDRVRQSAPDRTGRRPARSGARAEGLRPV